MAERLPVVGGDSDSWGTVLNGFLGVSHNADGTLKPFQTDYAALGATPATAGALRLTNNDYITVRNAANNGDVSLLRLNASNYADFGVAIENLKLRNNNWLSGRDAANSSDVQIARVNSSNEVEIANTVKFTGAAVGFYNHAAVAQPNSVTVSNYSAASRTFNRSSYTMDQLADLVCEMFTTILKGTGLHA